MQELFRDYPFAFADQSISYLLRELDRATYGRQLDSVHPLQHVIDVLIWPGLWR